MKDIKLTRYNHDTKKIDDMGTVSGYDLVNSMTTEDVQSFLMDWLNRGMKDYRDGVQVGMLSHYSHRTGQGSLARFALGIIIGLSEQEYTDARNETPVKMGKDIKKMLEDGKLDMGYMI